jgi:hypothetical protein
MPILSEREGAAIDSYNARRQGSRIPNGDLVAFSGGSPEIPMIDLILYESVFD